MFDREELETIAMAALNRLEYCDDQARKEKDARKLYYWRLEKNKAADLFKKTSGIQPR